MRTKGYGLRVVPFLFALIAYASFPLAAETLTQLSGSGAVSAAEAVMRAEELRLYDDPYWRTLVHYKPTLGGYESLVDDPAFFLAKDGKRNPRAELAATIEAFFSGDADGAVHPTARFPGRFLWIRERLGLDAGAFPHDGDADYRARVKAIDPGSVYLVFPSGYMKNPASLFGHTFLLVESNGQSRLLAHAINYGAIANDSVGAAYAFKGLIGAYPGYFSIVPYYEKIRDYGDIDMRDMWEYRLVLSDAEKDRLLRHVFELGNIYSDYFFIGENCSYNLLFLIEAAKPETRITDRFGPIVEPIATVKLAQRLGLADSLEYRPSLYARIESAAASLSGSENAWVRDVCKGRRPASDFPFAPATVAKRAAMLDLASDYAKFLYASGKMAPADYRSRTIAILSARKNLGLVEPGPEGLTPPRPDEAHGSSRVDASGGVAKDGPYGEASFRLTAHETMDREAGYAKNSQLAFVKVAARWSLRDRAFSLRHAYLADIVSLPKSDAYYANQCFNVTLGLAANRTSADGEGLAFRAKYGWGLSASPARWAQAYALAGFDAFFSPSYGYWTDLLLGGEVGLITDAGPWKSRLFATWQRTAFGAIHARFALGAEERIALGRDVSIIGSYSWNGDYGETWPEFGASLRVSF